MSSVFQTVLAGAMVFGYLIIFYEADQAAFKFSVKGSPDECVSCIHKTANVKAAAERVPVFPAQHVVRAVWWLGLIVFCYFRIL